MTCLNLISDASESSSNKATGRKVSPHPSTMEMVKEALKELDSRKGVSAQAIRGYIKEKYTTVDETRLKFMVRRTLNKGIETGVFVRPANSGSTTTGAQGRFRVTSSFWHRFIIAKVSDIMHSDMIVAMSFYFRLLPRPKQRRLRCSQRKMLIPMYRRHLNLRKLRQLKPRVKQAKKRSPQRKRRPQTMLSLRRLREMALPQRWPLLRSQRQRMLQGRVELSPNRAKLKKPLKHQKELRNQQLRKPERKLQRQRMVNWERRVLQPLRKHRGDEEKNDAGT
uniref:H15 domain-containing protein n=1 Tax=Cyprinus carpio carpio TaxID=630221 RepID=A0A9J7YWF9_CYPCA